MERNYELLDATFRKSSSGKLPQLISKPKAVNLQKQGTSLADKQPHYKMKCVAHSVAHQYINSICLSN